MDANVTIKFTVPCQTGSLWLFPFSSLLLLRTLLYYMLAAFLVPCLMDLVANLLLSWLGNFEKMAGGEVGACIRSSYLVTIILAKQVKNKVQQPCAKAFLDLLK